MSFTQLIYHIVFSTARREPTIPDESSRELYRLVNHILNKENCHVYKVGGIENHVHILTGVPADRQLSKVIQNLKRETSLILKNHPGFPAWKGWNEGYGAFTCSWGDKGSVVKYIENQKEHHSRESVEEEIRQILIAHGFIFNY